MERRVLRRAAEEALITSMQQRPVDARSRTAGCRRSRLRVHVGRPGRHRRVVRPRAGDRADPGGRRHDLVPDQADDYAWDRRSATVRGPRAATLRPRAGSPDDRVLRPRPGCSRRTEVDAPTRYRARRLRVGRPRRSPAGPVEVRPLRARPLAAGALAHPPSACRCPNTGRSRGTAPSRR